MCKSCGVIQDLVSCVDCGFPYHLSSQVSRPGGECIIAAFLLYGALLSCHNMPDRHDELLGFQSTPSSIVVKELHREQYLCMVVAILSQRSFQAAIFPSDTCGAWWGWKRPQGPGGGSSDSDREQHHNWRIEDLSRSFSYATSYLSHGTLSGLILNSS